MSRIGDALRALVKGASRGAIEKLADEFGVEARQRLTVLAETWSEGLETRIRNIIPRWIVLTLMLAGAAAVTMIVFAIMRDSAIVGYVGAAIADAVLMAAVIRWVVLSKVSKAIEDTRAKARELVPQHAQAAASWIREALEK